MEGEQEQVAEAQETEKETSQQAEGASTDETDESQETSEETTEGQTEGQTAKPVRDQAWWERRAKHFEGEYNKEKGKRQTYEKKYGRDGLAGTFANSAQKTEPVVADNGQPKSLEEVQDVKQFSQFILAEAKKQVRQELTESQKQQRMVMSEREARKEFDGSDGRPTYDEMFDGHVRPFLEQNPDAVKLLALMPDPARAAYTLGLLMNPDLQDRETKRTEAKAREGVVKNIADAAKQAATIKNGKTGGVTTGKKDYMSMSSADFEKELEAFKNNG